MDKMSDRFENYSDFILLAKWTLWAGDHGTRPCCLEPWTMGEIGGTFPILSVYEQTTGGKDRYGEHLYRIPQITLAPLYKLLFRCPMHEWVENSRHFD